jgi:hypothetical protein
LTIDEPEFPSEAFNVREHEVPSMANVLVAVGEELTAEICEEVDGLPA